MRSIRVFSTSFGNGIQEVQVADNATWEDLKRAIGISGANWTGIGRPTKTTYVSAEGSSASSMLNKDDIQINIFPKQMKAGNRALIDAETRLMQLQSKMNSLRQDVEDLVDILDNVENQVSNMIDNVIHNTPSQSPNPLSSRPSHDDFESALGLG